MATFVTFTTAETMESRTLDWIESPQTMAMAKGSLLRKPSVEHSLDYFLKCRNIKVYLSSVTLGAGPNLLPPMHSLEV